MDIDRVRGRCSDLLVTIAVAERRGAGHFGGRRGREVSGAISGTGPGGMRVAPGCQAWVREVGLPGGEAGGGRGGIGEKLGWFGEKLKLYYYCCCKTYCSLLSITLTLNPKPKPKPTND